MKLYEFPLSPNARKVRSVALELDIPLTQVAVDIFKGEQKTPEYLAKNPNGKVPLLEDEGLFLWESNAIVCYLASKRPERGLLPAEPRARAEVDRWLFWQTAHFGPAVGKIAFERIVKQLQKLGPPDPQVLEAAMPELNRLLGILDRHLATREYVAGPLSIADFALAAFLSLREPAGIDISGFPSLAAWLGRVESRESWKRSAPKQ
jgi:glutathione S-transferase